MKALMVLVTSVFATPGVRYVTNTSCDTIRLNVAAGITTQIVLEQEPKVTLFADKKHFKINTNAASPRSLAVIPVFESSELEQLQGGRAIPRSQMDLATLLDRNFKTNIFVFFENNNQLMFELRFVPKEKADYVLKVKQSFNGKCEL